MIIPPYLAALAAVQDPDGFERMEESYNKYGQRFCSTKAYVAVSRARQFGIPLFSIFAAMLFIVCQYLILLSFWSSESQRMQRTGGDKKRCFVMPGFDCWLEDVYLVNFFPQSPQRQRVPSPAELMKKDV